VSSTEDEQFREFVASRSAALLRVAFLLTGDHGHAEDLLQTALMKTSRRWAHLVDRDACYAYVRRVMVNTQTSWLRRRRVIENYVDVLPDTTEQVDDASAADAPVLLALGQLPPGMRAIVVLRFYEDLGEAETARVLGCSIGTVKSQTSRGLARMRVHLTEATPSSAARREEP